MSRKGARNATRRAITNVSTATYTVKSDDDYICVNRNGAVTLTLPGTPTQGDEYEIKDDGGFVSASQPLTLNGNGKLIDGASTFVMDGAKSAIKVTYNGTQYNVS
jgi:predicted glutamine amidotransferase